MKSLLLTPLLFFTFFIAFAQNGSSQIGARPAGLGYTSATQVDKWCAFNNPGGLGRVNQTSAFAAFENKYGISGLNSLGAGFLTALPIGTASITAYRFGDDLYNEQTISLGYGNKFGIASLGFKVNYIQFTIDEIGTKGTISIDFGGIAQITEVLRFGAYVRNINQAQLSQLNNEKVPTFLNAGIAYIPNDKLLLAIEAEKDIDHDAVFRAGLEYKFLEKFAARTGIKTNSFNNYFGLGFLSQQLNIDYALTRDQVLGLSHQVALSFTISKE